MNVRSLPNRLQKLEVRFEPPKGRRYIRLLSVAPGGEITREQIIRIAGIRVPLTFMKVLVASRLLARLGRLETALLPDDAPIKRWDLVLLNPDGTRKIVKTICWSRTRGSWTEPVETAP